MPLQLQSLRGKTNGEVRRGTCELFQQTRHLDRHVLWKMLRGLTTRSYPLVTRSFAKAHGIQKSAISQRFIQASREKLKTLMERPLGKFKLFAAVSDGTLFKGREMIAASGGVNNGKKTVLVLRQGATQNATVVNELLEDLARRGLHFSAPRLCVFDDAKALSAAAKRHAGKVAVQRSLLLLCISLNSCQSHKANSGPSIECNPISPSAQDGGKIVATISGRVRNVINAFCGPWWVQPWRPYLGS